MSSLLANLGPLELLPHDDNLRQIYQILHIAVNYHENNTFLPQYELLRQKKDQINVMTVKNAVLISETHGIVSKYIAEIFPDMMNEFPADDFYYADIYVPSRNLIIEINGPAHKNAKHKPKQKYVMKRKVLEKKGYRYLELESVSMLKENTRRDLLDQLRKLLA